MFKFALKHTHLLTQRVNQCSMKLGSGYTIGLMEDRGNITHTIKSVIGWLQSHNYNNITLIQKYLCIVEISAM